MLATVRRDLDRYSERGGLSTRLVGDLYVEVRQILAGRGQDTGRGSAMVADDLAVAIFLVMSNEGPTDPLLLTDLRRSLTAARAADESVTHDSLQSPGALPLTGGDS